MKKIIITRKTIIKISNEKKQLESLIYTNQPSFQIYPPLSQIQNPATAAGIIEKRLPILIASTILSFDFIHIISTIQIL